MTTNAFLETHLQRAEQEGPQHLATLPEVKRFLDTEIFETIQHVRTRILDNIAMLEFDVIAPKLLPHPRARLLEHGLVKRNNLLHSEEIDNGIQQVIGFFGNCLQIVLNIRGK